MEFVIIKILDLFLAVKLIVILGYNNKQIKIRYVLALIVDTVTKLINKETKLHVKDSVAIQIIIHIQN